MDRYHGIKISDSGVYQVLKRNGLNRLPQSAKKRQVVTRLYEKQVSGHHQLLSFSDDVDLNQKLAEWEDFYNYCRPHRSLKGKTPYEVLREKLQS